MSQTNDLDSWNSFETYFQACDILQELQSMAQDIASTDRSSTNDLNALRDIQV